MLRAVRFVAALSAAVLLLVSTMAQAAVVDNLHFTDGNGSTSVDQYPGIAGTRWLEPWTDIGSVIATVTDVDPLNGGGNYLSITGVEAGQGVTRRFLAPTDYSYRLELDLRVDSLPEAASLTLSTGSSRLIYTNDRNYIQTKANVSNGVGGEWYFEWYRESDGSVQRQYSGIDLLEGTVYHFDFWIDPVAKTYVPSVSDGVDTFVGTALAFRNQDAAVSNPFFELGAQSVSDTGTLSYSLDNIRLVPEPGSTALCLLGLLGIAAGGRRFRRRTRRF